MGLDPFAPQRDLSNDPSLFVVYSLLTSTLHSTGVMSLLRPLLLDIVPSVQQTAALALGRLANYSDDLAEAVVKGDILPQLVYSLAEQNRFYKKAAAFVLRAVAKHSPPLAQVGVSISYFCIII